MTLIILIVAAVALWALVRLGRQTEGPRRGQWRVAATLVAAAMIGGGGLALARGAWVPGLGLIAAGLYLTFASRMRAVAPRGEGLSEAEALSVLGLKAGATPDAINAAWRRLMSRAHPDQGGTQGLAARLNAARDRLLRR